MSETPTERLQRRVSELERENQRLRGGLFNPQGNNTVVVPAELEDLFSKAQETVHNYFQRIEADPSRGIIQVAGERYVLIRASALSMDFLQTIHQLYADRGPKESEAIGRSLLFDVAHSLGMSDARRFHRAAGVSDPLEKLSAGPVHFAYCGWARVDLKPECNPVANDDFFLIYDHPYSFEASSWLEAGQRTRSPVCVMNAAYSSGWCEESFGLELTAVEISCRAQGDEACTFVMAPPHRMAEHLKRVGHVDGGSGESTSVAVPTFFERKRTEEALLAYQEKLRSLTTELTLAEERERRRIAAHLHDEICQMLVSAKMHLATLADHVPDEHLELTTEMRRMLEVTIRETQNLTMELSPPVLYELGLEAAIGWFARRFQKQHALRIDVYDDDSEKLVPEESRITLFQAFRELLVNVAKHAGATRVEVRIACVNERLRLSVKDNGCGFDPHGDKRLRERPGGFGLFNIRERIDHLGGAFEIASTIGAGTEIVLYAPVDSPTR